MKTTPSLKTRAKGFALVVTLSLLILLTLIAVGLLSLSSVTLRASTAETAHQIARQNARLALTIAIGELQTHLGPDTRISARAETLAKHPGVQTSVSPMTPKAWWVGVADSDPDRTDPQTRLGGSNPQPVIWLVSGLNGNTPSAQLNGNLEEPVVLVGTGSLELENQGRPLLTGGEPIEAGRVPVTNSRGQVSGAYAYFVDDDGMKAQLVATNRSVRNNSAEGPRNGPHGGGVLPGTFPVGILSEMDGLGNDYRDDLHKLVSSNNLPLAGLPQPVAKSKFFSYTTSSKGVLADVKNGGLKKDLTAAFDPNTSSPTAPHAMFRNAFPESDATRYLAVDPKRLSEAPELRTNGYIHFGIFRDYYQLKNHLRVTSGMVGLFATTIEKGGLMDPNSRGHFYEGAVAPHASWSTSHHSGHPYKNYEVFRDAMAYRHNPITPVLSSLQQNAWVTRQTATTIRTNVQMFTSHYNPYNVGLILDGDNRSHTGPRMIMYPQVRFTINSSPPITRQHGMGDKLQAHARGGLVIRPGRSQVLGFRSSDERGREEDERLYSPTVSHLLYESVYRDFPNHNLPQNPRITYDFISTASVFMHGMDDQGANFEVAQVFYAPFPWNDIQGRPGRTITLEGAPGVNNMAKNALYMRTSREPGSAIRPLVDANIRAIWNNPRWDSKLGLPLLAAHSETSQAIPSDNIPQMTNNEPPNGFTYLGSDRDPSGYERVILFDVPREDLVSLGQLQHASAGRFSYEPTYIVGNSYANPRLPLDNWWVQQSDTFSGPRGLPSAGSFKLFDASFLVNERLWDEFIFTTIPQFNNNYRQSMADPPEPPLTAAYYTSLLDGEQLLPNPRFIPYEPNGSSFTITQLRNPGNPQGTTGAFRHNAGHILVDGAFNVNSTSVDAWEAFLSGTHDLPVLKVDRNTGRITGFSPPDSVEGIRFPRVQYVAGDGMKTDNIDENYWIGFRELSQQEIRDLATAIVAEIRERGPFLTMGQFVNRKLEESELGKSGALQAALDATVNKDLDNDFELPAASDVYPQISANSTQGAGFPGQLLQGDVLQALSPYMQVRSDTFTIRAYGEARNPVTGRIEAKAWCEATVQRMPDAFPDATGGNTPLQDLILPSSRFGREFRAISFRWLHPDEV